MKASRVARARIFNARMQYAIRRDRLGKATRMHRPKGTYLQACRAALDHLRQVVREEHIALLKRERDYYKARLNGAKQ